MRLGLGLGVGLKGIFPPVNISAPAISGNAIRGQTLSCTTGSWSGQTPTFAYQWRRDGVAIGSATNSTYVLTASDVGTSVDCVVTATNPAKSVSLDSNNLTITRLPAASHDFERSSTQSLTMTDANFGAFDTAKFAISVCVKRESTSGAELHTIMTQIGALDTGASYILRFNNDKVNFITSVDGTSVNGQLLSTTTLTDTAAFHHILVHFDSANATPGDRMKMWIDGAEITAFDIDTNPTAAAANSIAAHRIGSNGLGSNAFDGLIYNAAFFSGTLPAVTDLRDATTGMPKDVSGLPGLYSWLDFVGDSLVSDGVLAADWTNVNTVTSSTTIPF